MIAFDARAAKSLPAGEHMTFDQAPGLRLVATATRRTWTYRYRSPADGAMRQIRIGHWPAMSAPAAWAAWEGLRAARDAGQDPAAAKRAGRVQQQQAQATARAARVADAYTVRRLADDYLTTYARTVAARTYGELQRLFGRELSAFERLPAASLTRAHAYDLLDAMRGRPVVAQRLRQGLGAAWDQALDAGRLPADAPNWWRLVLRGKLPSRGKAIAGQQLGEAKRVLSEAEVAALLRWLPNFSRDVCDALTLYLWTCSRGAEILAAERSEITREADGVWWTVPRARLKMRRNPLTVDLRVPLVGRALAIADRRLAAHDGRWLFPSVGASGHVEQKAIGVAVWTRMPYSETRPEVIRSRLPVTHWAPHDLRRTGRTMLAALGCPAEVAEAILGHQLPGMQGVYNRHSYDAERRQWLTALAGRLEQLVAPQDAAAAAPPQQTRPPAASAKLRR
jgi:integrase